MSKNKYGMQKPVQNELYQCISGFERMEKGGIGVADGCVKQACEMALNYINELETRSIDFAKVVRCKDCCYYNKQEDYCDMIYFDPPYFNSVGNYNDEKRGFEGWTPEHEQKLYELLDKLDKQGTRWALSNNLKYDNEFLNSWKDKYNVYHLSGDYLNCNYHKKDRETKDIEVLITNY